ncbi:hypothetical protein ABLL_1274 [Arcobacter sp. L]|nr:hypothetical protein ABLL_1274 [Arcobacter sp. L]
MLERVSNYLIIVLNKMKTIKFRNIRLCTFKKLKKTFAFSVLFFCMNL